MFFWTLCHIVAVISQAWLVWKPPVSSFNEGILVSRVNADDPQLWRTMVLRKIPPDFYFPWIWQLFKDEYGGLTCARTAHRSGTGVLPGHPHTFIAPIMTQNFAGYLPDVFTSPENFWPVSKIMLQLFFKIKNILSAFYEKRPEITRKYFHTLDITDLIVYLDHDLKVYSSWICSIFVNNTTSIQFLTLRQIYGSSEATTAHHQAP